MYLLEGKWFDEIMGSAGCFMQIKSPIEDMEPHLGSTFKRLILSKAPL